LLSTQDRLRVTAKPGTQRQDDRCSGSAGSIVVAVVKEPEAVQLAGEVLHLAADSLEGGEDLVGGATLGPRTSLYLNMGRKQARVPST
jgi:hypothetical protein